MGDVGAGASALGVYHTGAVRRGGAQRTGVLSLGGKRSKSRAVSLWARRTTSAVSLRVDFAAGSNGTGNGILEAPTADAARWTPPGGTAGDAVTIAAGETKVLPGGDASQYVIVTRTGAGDLQGSDVVQLLEGFNEAAGGSDFTEAERAAGHAHYRGLILRNDGDSAITDLRVWQDSGSTATIRIGKETPDGSGDIQSIADEDTAPSGITWNTGSNLSLGLIEASLAAGAGLGLWIETSVSAGADGAPGLRAGLRCRFTYDGDTYTGEIAGWHRVEESALDRWEIYCEKDAEPDPAVATARDTSTDGTYSFSLDLDADSTYYLVAVKRNAYGIRSAPSVLEVIETDSTGDIADTRPLAPVDVQAVPAADGKVLVSAVYYPGLEAETEAGIDLVRADRFLVYATSDGSDPALATPVEVSMRNNGPDTKEYLMHETAASVEGAPWRVLVKTRRGTGASALDSDFGAEATAAGATVGPARVAGGFYLGDVWGLAAAAEAGPTATEIIDAGNNIYWSVAPGSVALYADTVLVFRAVWMGADSDDSVLYIPDDWSMATEALDDAGAGVGAGVVEVGTWDVSNKDLYLLARGRRRVHFDVENRVATFNALATGAALATSGSSAVTLERWDAGDVQVWDIEAEQPVPVLSVAAADGVCSVAGAVSHGVLSQAAIEGL